MQHHHVVYIPEFKKNFTWKKLFVYLIIVFVLLVIPIYTIEYNKQNSVFISSTTTAEETNRENNTENLNGRVAGIFDNKSDFQFNNPVLRIPLINREFNLNSVVDLYYLFGFVLLGFGLILAFVGYKISTNKNFKYKQNRFY